jgi:heat shock protein HslJ
MKSFITRATGVVALGIIATGCGASARAPDLPGLDGTAWVLTELPGQTLAPRPAVTLQFAGDRVSGSDGCNRFSGRYSVADGIFHVVPSLASTQMACPPEVSAQAQAFITALTSAASYRIEDRRLELLSAAGASLAALAAQSQELAGTAWRATGINNGKGAVASVVSGSTVSLEFGPEGRASGTSGCNRYTAGYTVDGPSLKFSQAASTRMMCADSGVMEQEQHFLRALESVATARVEGDRLELRTAAGAVALTLYRAGSD